MEIPMLTNFIEGLKLFFESKRTRWFTLIFVIGAVIITIWETLGAVFDLTGLVFTGGVFPIYFMLAAFMSLLGLTRFVASDESYRESLIYTLVWGVVSVFVLIGMVFFTFGLFMILFVGVAFLGWIVFQSYFSTRTALGFAESVDIGERSLLVGLFYGAIYIFNYILIIGALIFGIVIFAPVGLVAIVLAALGALLALGFNFVNGLILVRERNKSMASGVSVLGLFISLYSAYFIYNVLKGFDPSLDLVSIVISVAFILYTMSGIGRTLAGRAELDTRWKISKEFAAAITYFLASGFMFVDSVFTSIVIAPSLQGVVSDVIKLLLFPFIAFLMVLLYLYKSRKALKDAETISDEPVADEEEPILSEDEPAIIDEPVEEEEVPHVPEEESVEELSEEPSETDPLEEEFSEDE